MRLCVVAEIVFRGVLLTPKVPKNDKQFRHAVSANWPREIDRMRGEDVFRIVGLADSFGAAEGHNNYHHLLEQEFAGSAPEFEVINLSVAEFDLPDELAMLKRFGIAYDPDLVLHGFFIGNDFTLQTDPLMRFRGISVRPKSGMGRLRPRNFSVREWSRRVFVYTSERWKLKAAHKRSSTPGAFTEDRYLEIEANRIRICERNRSDGDLVAGVFEFIDEIATVSAAAGSDYIILLHPDQFQVETNLFSEICERYGYQSDRFDLDKPQRAIIELCRERGYKVIDLLPAFRRDGAAGGLYRFRDSHYNDAGNALAARQIAEYMRRQGPVVARRSAKW